MGSLFLILLFSTFGGSLLLQFLRGFLLKEPFRFRLDWDGLLERLCLTYIILAAPQFWLFIPIIILIKTVSHLYSIGYLKNIAESREPGAVSQKVLFKSELAFDLLASPAFAILVGVLAR